MEKYIVRVAFYYRHPNAMGDTHSVMYYGKGGKTQPHGFPYLPAYKFAAKHGYTRYSAACALESETSLHFMQMWAENKNNLRTYTDHYTVEIVPFKQ